MALTRGLANGDEEAFREFHALYFDRVYKFLLVVARGNEAEAGDALQETFLRVVKHAKIFESEEAFWHWLKAVARNAARDAGRKQQRYRDMLRRFALSEPDHSAAPLREDALLDKLLEESLRDLDAESRRLIEARYFEEMKIREIAARLGTTEKAVESRLVRIRGDLRRRILRALDTA